MTSDMKVDYWEMMEYAKNIKEPVSLMSLLVAWEMLRQLLEDENTQMTNKVKHMKSEQALRKWLGGHKT